MEYIFIVNNNNKKVNYITEQKQQKLQVTVVEA